MGLYWLMFSLALNAFSGAYYDKVYGPRDKAVIDFKEDLKKEQKAQELKLKQLTPKK